MTALPHPRYYQVGVFALVRHNGAYLLAQPQDALLPGATQLPGFLLHTESGAGLAELGLRKMLISQLGVAVGMLYLVGSFAVRLPEGDSRLSLIFASDYVSGMLNPSGTIRAAEWQSAEQLRAARAPEWLFSAIQEYETARSAESSPTEGRGLLPRLGRRR